MKRVFICIISTVMLLNLHSCEKWNTVERLDLEGNALDKLYSERDSIKWAAEDAREEENEAAYQTYLANLREYKTTKRHKMFGWFNGWAPDMPAKYFQLDQVPDSVDIISVWGGWHSLTEEKKAQLKSVQEDKGTKVVIGWIVTNIGTGINSDREAWPEDDFEAIDMYAQAIVDTIYKYNYDGFDFDYEPSWGAHGNIVSSQPDSGKENENYFIRSMREKLGPDKLFTLNGSIHYLDPVVADCFDQYIYQAYTILGTTCLTWYNRTITRFGDAIPSEKMIYTDAFQGKDNTFRQTFVPKYVQFVLDMKAKGVHIGGVGAFHINQDAELSFDYPNIREAINVMNPAIIE